MRCIGLLKVARKLGERDTHRAVVFVKEVDDKGVLVAVVLDDIVVHVHKNSALLLFVHLKKEVEIAKLSGNLLLL